MYSREWNNLDGQNKWGMGNSWRKKKIGQIVKDGMNARGAYVL